MVLRYEDSGRRTGWRHAMAKGHSGRGPQRRGRRRWAPRILPDQLGRNCGPLGNDRWAAARREMLAELARLFGVTEPAVSEPHRLPTTSPSGCISPGSLPWPTGSGRTRSSSSRSGSRPLRTARSTWTTTSNKAERQATDALETTRLAGPGGHGHAGNVRGVVPVHHGTPPAPNGSGRDRRWDDRAGSADRRGADGRGENGGRLVRGRVLGPARRPGSIRRPADDGHQQPDVRPGRRVPGSRTPARRT